MTPTLARHPPHPRYPCQHVTHTSTPPMPPTQACHPRHPHQHVTHASTLPMRPTLARHPRKHVTHATHASTSPTQVRHAHHPRQHEEDAISQTQFTLLDVYQILDYDYIKNHYRLIATDLSRQKEFDADPKAIQQIEFVGQLKKVNDDNNKVESMFISTILEKSKETRLNFLKEV